jgi:hypothetical protein
MKKTLILIAVLFMVLSLLVTGCKPTGGGVEGGEGGGTGGGGDNGGGTGGGDGNNVLIDEIFSATPKTQSKANVTITDDTVTFSLTGSELWGELRAAETAPWNASDYTGIKFDYKATGNATIFVQDTNTIFISGFNDSDGWGAINMADSWETLTLPFSILKLPSPPWFGEDKPFNKSAIIKLCFQISDGSSSDKKFEVRNFAGY